MSRQKQVFTSESVTEGHPDKICDQISDAILDAIYTDDPMGRVACETLVTTGLVVVAGEISTSTYVDIPKIVRDTVRGVGYTRAKFGFDGDTCGVVTAIDEQSPDIAGGVDHALEERTGEAATHGILDTLGAGDQGMMFGFAVNETPELMPMPIMLAHKLARRLAAVRLDHTLKYLRPDGKTQVTVEYENGKPKEIETVIVSTQHGPDVSNKQLTADILEQVLKPVLPKGMVDYKKLNLYVNPSGKFVVGGPQGDTGVTGRKIIVDTYGGMARHGGGCFSGKDPTKVDRSGAYYTRYVAKNVVAAGLAEKCEIQVAYAIGKAHPVSVRVDTFNTETVDIALIEKLVRENFDFRPAAIINELDLRRPIFKQTAAYGHFGREEEDFTWERIDKAQTLKKGAGA